MQAISDEIVNRRDEIFGELSRLDEMVESGYEKRHVVKR